MHRIRITYTIEGALKFISHADTMRLLFRLFRISGLPLGYSQGFSPHPLASFGPARPVGVESNCELIDISLSEEKDLIEMKDVINRIAPQGLTVMGIKSILKQDYPLSALNKATYIVRLPGGVSVTQKECDELLARPEIMVKKCKKGIEEQVNIRPFIYHSICEEDTLTFVLKIGEHSVPPLIFLKELLSPYNQTEGLTIIRKNMEV